jgi:hypothetical protein
MRQADASDRRTPIIRIATDAARDVKFHPHDRSNDDAQPMTPSLHSFANFRRRAASRALADAPIRMKSVGTVVGADVDLIL